MFQDVFEVDKIQDIQRCSNRMLMTSEDHRYLYRFDKEEKDIVDSIVTKVFDEVVENNSMNIDDCYRYHQWKFSPNIDDTNKIRFLERQNQQWLIDVVLSLINVSN